MQITNLNQKIENKYDELVLVVKRSILFNDGDWQGLITNNQEKYLNIIKNEKEFLPRSIAECDTSYKQIIPYLIFINDNKLFLMQRKSESSEQRLSNKFSLGIGGHIRQDDINSDSIIDWSKREFHEEIDYNGNLKIKPIGMINDDSNDVGKVHIGFVFLLLGDSNLIKIKSELKHGELFTLNEIQKFFDKMETWSQISFNYLKQNLEIIKN